MMESAETQSQGDIGREGGTTGGAAEANYGGGRGRDVDNEAQPGGGADEGEQGPLCGPEPATARWRSHGGPTEFHTIGHSGPGVNLTTPGGRV